MYHRGLTNRKRLAAGLGAVALLLAARVADAVLTQDQKCQSAVVKFSRLYEDKRIKAVDKCEQDKLKLLLPPSTTCPDALAAGKIASALTLLQTQIKNNCCGPDKNCATPGDNLALTTIGWEVFTGLRCDGGNRQGEPCTTNTNCPCDGPDAQCVNEVPPLSGNFQATCASTTVCPSIESSVDCDFSVGGFDQVDECLACIGDFATDQSLGFSYGGLKPPKSFVGLPLPQKKVELCKRELKKVALFYAKKRNFLRICNDKVIKATLVGPCPDATAAGKIATEETKLLTAIEKKCAGPDMTFGGGDDYSLDEIGVAISCPNVTVPGGANCGAIGQITSIQEWADCLVCMNEYKVDCNTARSTDIPLVNAATCNPACGDGNIDAGETCDDGNVSDGDGCPASCVISPCTPTAGDTIATVNFTASEPIAGTTVYIEYPDGTVRIPGTGNQTSVIDSFTLNTGDSLTPNDLEYAIQVVHFDSTGTALTLPDAYTITFDNCQGAPPATDADFNCRVLSAASDGITPVEVAGVSCSVDVP